MGTPEFAVASLQALHQSHHEIAAVVTVPDKPAGRGRKLRHSAVKEYALSHELPLLQPEKLRSEDFLDDLTALQADLFVVVAFRMLPRVVWEIPAHGTINLHASLLPQYRGAAPINWAIINGEKETGVTTFFINENIDTGAMIYQVAVPISDRETAGSLHDTLRDEGAKLLLKTVDAIDKDEAPRLTQKAEGELKSAPRIYKEDMHVNFDRPVQKVYDHIRGLIPYPAAYAFLENGEQSGNFKFYEVEKREGSPSMAPGSVKSEAKNELKVACQDGWLVVLEGQLAGKKRLRVENLLNGLNLSDSAKMV